MIHGRRDGFRATASWVAVGSAALSVACARPDPSPTDFASVRTDVEILVQSFHAADTARDAEAVVGLMWPDFEMLVDGQFLAYDQVAEGSRVFMASLASFHTVWSDLRIIPISPSGSGTRESTVCRSIRIPWSIPGCS